MFQTTVKKVDIKNPAYSIDLMDSDEASEIAQARLRRVSVRVTHASEVTLRAIFDIYVDGDWGSANVGARLVAVGCAKIDGFEIDGVIAIRRAAHDIGIDPKTLARSVKEKLNSALCEYENWNRDEELDRARLARGDL